MQEASLEKTTWPSNGSRRREAHRVRRAESDATRLFCIFDLCRNKRQVQLRHQLQNNFTDTHEIHAFMIDFIMTVYLDHFSTNATIVMYISIYVFIYIYIYLCTMFIYIYICIYIYDMCGFHIRQIWNLGPGLFFSDSLVFFRIQRPFPKQVWSQRWLWPRSMMKREERAIQSLEFHGILPVG